MLNNSYKFSFNTLSKINVSIQPVRYRRVNVNKPRPPCFEKAQIIAGCRPIYPKPCDFYFPPSLRCRLPIKKYEEQMEKQEENPYERILATELMDRFKQSKMILFLHGNRISGDEKDDSWRTFKRQNMELSQHARSTVIMAVENTIYEPILVLFNSSTKIITCPEEKLSKALELLKKKTHLILMAGILDGQFLSRSQLDEYGKMDLTMARSQLVNTLNLASSHLTQYISLPHITLVAHLDQHVEIQNKSESENPSAADSA